MANICTFKKKNQRQRITINLLKSKDNFTALQFLYNLVSHPATN